VRTLHRSSSERQIGGVCGGIAQYSGTDPTLIRVLFIVLAVMGAGLLLYSLLWIFVPEEARSAAAWQQPGPAASRAA